MLEIKNVTETFDAFEAFTGRFDRAKKRIN